MEVGKRIYKLRVSRNMTQKELAEFLNVTDKAVSKWESGAGNPDIELIPKISKLFNVSTDYLLGNSELPHVVGVKQKKGIKKEHLFLCLLILSLILFVVSTSLLIKALVEYDVLVTNSPKYAGGIQWFYDYQFSEMAEKFGRGKDDPILYGSNYINSNFTKFGNKWIANYMPLFDGRWFLLLLIIIPSLASFVVFLILFVVRLKNNKKTKLS